MTNPEDGIRFFTKVAKVQLNTDKNHTFGCSYISKAGKDVLPTVLTFINIYNLFKIKKL